MRMPDKWCSALVCQQSAAQRERAPLTQRDKTGYTNPVAVATHTSKPP